MANSTEYRTVFTAKDDMSGTIKNVKDELNSVGKSATTASEKINKQFDRIINSTAPLKKQLRDLQKLMAEMNYNGQSNTEEFNKVAQAAGRIKDALSDASAAVNRFSSDTMNIQAATQAFQGIAAAGSVASGVMGLFGTKNEEVQRAILKVQSAMAILNGVQSIANILNKDSILMLKLKALREKVAAAATTKNTIATTANTAATTVNTTAQKGHNVAVAIGKALMGDFTGLLILGAGALLTYGMAADDASDSQDDFNNSTDLGTQYLKNHNEAMKDVSREINNQKMMVDGLVSILENENSALETKKKALEQLKEILPDVNGYIDAEGKYHGNAAVQAKKHAAALDQLSESLIAFKLIQKFEDKIVDAKAGLMEATQALENFKKQAAEWKAGRSGLMSTLDDINDFLGGTSGNDIIEQQTAKLQAEVDKQKKLVDDAIELKERAKDEFNRSGTQQTRDAAVMSGGNASEAARRITGAYDKQNEKATGSKGGKTTQKGKGGSTTTKTDKQDGPKAVKDSLQDLENQLSDLQKKVKYGLIPESDIQSTLDTIESLKKRIQEKKIELRLEVDPEEAAFEKAAQQMRQDMSEAFEDAEEKFKEIKWTPDFSSFDKAMGKAKFDTTTLTGIQQQMEFNDQLISQLNEIISIYAEWGDTTSDAYNKVKTALDGVIESNAKLTEQAQTLKGQEEHWKKQEENAEAYSQMIGNIGSAFSNLSGAMEGSTQQWMQFTAQAMQGISEMIPLIRSLIVAKNAEALASGTAEGAKLAWPMNLVAIASIVATIAGIFASIPKFASGGIVGGGQSMYGDKILTRLNPGEMVLNKRQQRRLFDILDSTSAIGNNGGDLTFRIKGSDLYGTLKNYSRTQAKFGKNTGII